LHSDAGEVTITGMTPASSLHQLSLCFRSKDNDFYLCFRRKNKVFCLYFRKKTLSLCLKFRKFNMIQRNLLVNLRQWANRRNRKPLVIRGARQVGKTTLVKEFAKEFNEFVMLNLERADDKRIFEIAETPQQVMEILRLTRMRTATVTDAKTLLFIDEIQSEPKAIGMLRYFYEDMPQLYVIAAGSRLQELFKTGVSFPVGRVEYMSMRPCSFDEFLSGMGENETAEMVRNTDVPGILHEHLCQLFQTYALVGGMPEIVAEYAATRSVSVYILTEKWASILVEK
jgi:hypothetical protein